MIAPWTPWWKNPSVKSTFLSHDGSQLVGQISTDDATFQGLCQNLSSMKYQKGQNLLSLSLKQLTRAEPSLLLRLIDIFYSYHFTLCLYNGDWQSDPLGTSTIAVSMSKVMRDGAKT